MPKSLPCSKARKKPCRAPRLRQKRSTKRRSYGIGVDIGRNFKHLGLDLDLDVLTKSLKDACTGKKLDFSEDELRTIMSGYQNELKQKQVIAMKAIGEANQKAGGFFKLRTPERRVW